MSYELIRPFFQENLAKLSLEEHEDAFNIANVPNTLLEQTYCLEFSERVRTSQSHSDLSLEVPIILRVFKKGFLDTREAFDAGLALEQQILKQILSPNIRLNKPSFKNILFDRASSNPLTGENDNAVMIEIGFTFVIYMKI